MMGSLRCLFTMHVKMFFNRTEDPQDERRATLSESLFEIGFACPGPTLKKPFVYADPNCNIVQTEM